MPRTSPGTPPTRAPPRRPGGGYRPAGRARGAGSAYCGGYLNGAPPGGWIGAGIYVADDALGTGRAGGGAPTPRFLATGFFAAALLAAAFLVVFFIRRPFQQPANR